ncbi:DUF3515 family protein [Aeromicrobium sp.]|uniref:DUF3515 family protein n=1 Tax=Aeromicrobium sp. TaxID=1871063 RepID=UPI0019BE2147|nr:DUF3515 family protein [Aeromicrobium sp.]MBC7633902.1 DUF3515 family protein [Aeromicrobium sp.]
MNPLHLPPIIAVLLITAGCGGGLAVDTYPTTPGTKVDCKALFADGPQKVAGQDQVFVHDENASAWGDPAIVLRCGVDKPDGLTPSSQCNTVRGIDWLADTTADGYLFTTIGRKFFVSVEVPKEYAPEADALADVADAVAKHDPSIKPCV